MTVRSPSEAEAGDQEPGPEIDLSSHLISNSQPANCGDPQIQQVIDFVRQRAGEAWLVGGYVRDWLLQRETGDVDFVVSRGAISLAREVADAFDGHFFVLDEGRDVARAVVRRTRCRDLTVDVARLRATELAVDLSQRDFTINAMAVPVREGFAAGVIDLHGGRADLDRGIIRAVAADAFLDDPLRLLRAVRQAAELGFRIDDATDHLMRRDAPRLRTVAAERIRDELARILASPGNWHSLRVLQDTALLAEVLPEAAALVGIIQAHPHHQDVFDHTLCVLAHLEAIEGLIWPPATPAPTAQSLGDSMPFIGPDAWAELAAVIRPFSAELRAHLDAPVSAGRTRRDCLAWAALAHDWGKPAMRSTNEEGRIRFLAHDDWGATVAQHRLRALRMSSGEVAHISRLVGLHMRPGYFSHDYPPSRRAIYRFFRDAAGSGPDCVLLSLADYAAIRAGHDVVGAWDSRLKTAELLLHACFRERTRRLDPVPLLDGRQLMSIFGLAEGPGVGRLLEALREAQAVGEVTSYDEALVWVDQRLQKGGA
jgi:tRNA nucleotidyltransferase/poly(A) polymerase